jgi:hypothetical protein
MSITQIGIEGEQLARKILNEHFKVYDIQQLDWLVHKDSKWYAVEVKHKEMYVPPPFKGQGLNVSQINRRMQLYKETGIRCLLLVIDKSTKEIYWQWLDILEETEYHDTRNKVRIYNIKNFKKIKARC